MKLTGCASRKGEAGKLATKLANSKGAHASRSVIDRADDLCGPKVQFLGHFFPSEVYECYSFSSGGGSSDDDDNCRDEETFIWSV